VKVRLLLGVVALAVVGLVPLSASAAQTCVTVNAGPLHAQVGYAPNGPGDCKSLP
jgi:hypothetical protein